MAESLGYDWNGRTICQHDRRERMSQTMGTMMTSVDFDTGLTYYLCESVVEIPT